MILVGSVPLGDIIIRCRVSVFNDFPLVPVGINDDAVRDPRDRHAVGYETFSGRILLVAIT